MVHRLQLGLCLMLQNWPQLLHQFYFTSFNLKLLYLILVVSICFISTASGTSAVLASSAIITFSNASLTARNMDLSYLQMYLTLFQRLELGIIVDSSAVVCSTAVFISPIEDDLISLVVQHFQLVVYPTPFAGYPCIHLSN